MKYKRTLPVISAAIFIVYTAAAPVSAEQAAPSASRITVTLPLLSVTEFVVHQAAGEHEGKPDVQEGSAKGKPDKGIKHSNVRKDSAHVLGQIRQGNFTSLKELDERQIGELQELYEHYRDTDTMQWVYADIDQDGDPELIWQEKVGAADSQMHRILAVFALTPEGSRRILWDANDMTEFYFCQGDKIIYNSSFRGAYDYDYYGVCEFDADGEHTIGTFYEIYDIYDVTEYDSATFWSGFDWAEEMDYETGVYYVMGTLTADGSAARVLLEKGEWLERFRDDIGGEASRFLQ